MVLKYDKSNQPCWGHDENGVLVDHFRHHDSSPLGSLQNLENRFVSPRGKFSPTSLSVLGRHGRCITKTGTPFLPLRRNSFRPELILAKHYHIVMHYWAVIYLENCMPQVIRSIDIQAGPSAVWRWLATQEALRRWIGSNLEINLRVGGAYRFLGPDDKTWVSGTVVELEPERSLILSWLEEGSGWAHPARVVITLAPIATGTRVTLIHDGFEGIGRSDWVETVRDYERGADLHRVLDRLADLVNAGDAQQY